MSNNLGQYLPSCPTYCINLFSRTDRKKKFLSFCKRRHFEAKVCSFRKNGENPAEGCKTSHLEVIEKAIKLKLPYVLILEDDVKFLEIPKFKELPKEWDMLYLGGSVLKKITDHPLNNDEWVRCSTLLAHAYILNLKNQKLVSAIRKSLKSNREYDSYLANNVHLKFNVFMHTPMLAIQNEDRSDISGQITNYESILATLEGYQKPDHLIVRDEYVLRLPDLEEKDLPNVSIVTPTYDRHHFFSLAYQQFCNFDYPKEKLEWIIVDDTPDYNKSWGPLIPKNDKRIKFHYINPEDLPNKERMGITVKRNKCAELASHKFIIHMDDDDIYPKESIIARVKCLLKYQNTGIRCVGCSEVGIFDLVNNTSALVKNPQLYLSEASLAYTKKFWEEQKFNPETKSAEVTDIVHNRFNEIMDIPYAFVVYPVTHKNNFTGDLRKIGKNETKDKNGNDLNFFNFFEPDVKISLQKFIVILLNQKNNNIYMIRLWKKNNHVLSFVIDLF